jgi:hypothetical protein
MSSHSSPKQQLRPSAVIKVGQYLHLRGTSLMTFLIYWLMVLTFPNFFIINPAAEESIARQIALWLCLFGWLIQSLITPIMLWKISDGYLYPIKWIPLTTLVWPASIVFAQMTAFIQTGSGFLSYLIDYPIFVLTDIALPALIMWKWYEMRLYTKQSETL